MTILSQSIVCGTKEEEKKKLNKKLFSPRTTPYLKNPPTPFDVLLTLNLPTSTFELAPPHKGEHSTARTCEPANLH